ncbi:MAG TPA: TraB/GumN family protein [Burkholderiales bacterium]|nr:TraB/GumN family protein [Burkholderiales bacterium]
MKKLASVAFGCLLVLAAGFAFAGDGTAEFSKGLLWKVERADTQPSYIFGTIHLDDARLTNFPALVEKTFMRSKSFTMEMIIDETSTEKFTASMLRDDGSDLKVLLGEPLYTQTTKVMLEEYGMPSELTARFKPWALMLTLVLPKERQGAIVDDVLYQQALEQHKSVYQLESIEEQIAVFDGLSMEVQIGLLKEAVEHHDMIPGLVEKSIKAYLKRDLGAMWEINNSMLEDEADKTLNDAFLQRVLYNRNMRMAERMQPRLAEGAAFIAIGALHLYGDRGVLSLLQSRGYRVTRLY